LFVEDSERYVIEGSGKGPRLETWKGGSFYRELWETNDGRLWKQNISLYGTSARGTWREGSFTGDPERYVNESSGNAYLSLQTPRWGTWWEGSFTGEFERPERALCSQRVLSLWQLCEGNLEGGLLYWKL